jgi:hypothetical protein
MIMGHIFKNTIPDETDEERRELERCVCSQVDPHELMLNILMSIYISEWSQKQHRASQGITYVEKPEEKGTQPQGPRRRRRSKQRRRRLREKPMLLKIEPDGSE